MEDFIVYLDENKEVALSAYTEYYSEKASEEGVEMQGDERYYGDDGYDHDPEELYEDFAHCTGHSANYEGAFGVIKELGVDYNVDPNDEELQWEVLLILGQEPS